MPSPAPARSIGSHLLARALNNGLVASWVAFYLKSIQLGAKHSSLTIRWWFFIASLLSSPPLVLYCKEARVSMSPDKIEGIQT